jgi:starvation-inducible outer membrane lipoprotein
MRRLLFLLALASTLAGCASTPPTCDGNDRRPINTPDHAEVFYPSCGVTV